MCFHSKQSRTAQELKNRFNIGFDDESIYNPAIYNGFQFPKTPIITNTNPNNIQLFHWGLIPYWAKDVSIRKNTLNARIETIHEKPSFKNCINNRCLIIADAFYEWQWLDDKGTKKQKYELIMPNNEIFAFAGLWSQWKNTLDGTVVNSYTIITTEANKLMSTIHNSKRRMPIILSKENEIEWLNGSPLVKDNDFLIANKI